MSERSREEARLLMIAASSRDERHASRLFGEDGITVEFCKTLPELSEQIQAGAAAILINDIALRRDQVQPLLSALKQQPNWSDLPVILVAADERPGWLSREPLANLMILRQPVHVDTLLSVARTAIASRFKQYQVRDLLVRQAEVQDELRRIDQRKDEFLATLAHELRNPISPIKSALDLIELTGQSLQQESELCNIMHRQIRQLTRIVDDLLDVSRITRNRIRLHRSVFDLRDAIRAGIEASSPFIRESNQRLQVELGEEPIYVDGDATRLAQCFANLLNNAAKYTPAGGNILLKTSSDAGMILVSVQDDGIGIAPDQLSSVFELFRQHDVDHERGQAGLGIGLTLVQRLMHLHAGAVEVFSDGIGKGSTFTIRIPVAVPPTITTPEHDCQATRTTAAYHVLIVEDTRAIRIVLQRLLESMGHIVTVAEDGIEGLAKAISDRPQIILSDVSMPKMNGLQLARLLRENRDFDQTPIVAMTGYGRSEDRAEVLEAGFNEHLTKPVDIADLRRVLATISNHQTD